MPDVVRLGTRGSLLALTQSRLVASQLEQTGCTVEIVVISTIGDRITDRLFTSGDGKGVFVAEIEQALLSGAVDVAVHSLKDLPGEMPEGLLLAAVPPREDPRDVLIGHTASTLAALPAGSVVGTSSLRRRAQLLAARPDLQVADLRGNLDTRLRKLDEGQYDAIILAAAGIHRLGLVARVTEYLVPAVMMPAVGQGALAIQTRAADTALIARLAALHHAPTAHAVRAERAVLAAIGGGCAVPLGALATIDGALLTLTAVLASLDGTLLVREQASSSDMPESLGQAVALRLLADARAAGIEVPLT
jgi:hydroxymethylbilane synthase